MSVKTALHKKHNPIFAVSIALVLLVGLTISLVQIKQEQQSLTRAAETNCAVNTADIAITADETALLNGINTYRAAQGLGTLTFNPALKKAAKWLTNDMSAKNYLDHTDSLGRAPAKRFTDCGLNSNGSWGENIAQNDGGSPDSILTMWKESAGHNKNLLDPKFTQVGLAKTGGFWAYDASDDNIPPIVGPSTAAPTATSIFSNPTGSTTTPVPSTTMTDPNATPDPSTSSTPLPNTSINKGTPAPPTSTPGPSLTPTPIPATAIDMKITVAIKLPGIGVGGNTSPQHLSRRISVEIFDLDNKSVAKGNGFLTYDGSNFFTGLIHMGTMKEGQYYLKLVGQEQVLPDLIQSTTLQALVVPQFQRLLTNSNNVLPPVTLLQGDLDADNTLTINDYNLSLSCFQFKKCDQDPILGLVHNLLDFNDDGKVDVTDYNVLLHNFWENQGD
jgi:uncharacterized protein YkwD